MGKGPRSPFPAAHEDPGPVLERRRRRTPADPGARPRPHRPGSAGPGSAEPDARFSFANERTFLAWIRTALALVAAGLAIVQLLPPFHGIHWGRRAIGMPLILLGGIVAVRSYLEWASNQRALRQGGALRRSRLPELLAIVIALVAVVAAVLALVSG